VVSHEFSAHRDFAGPPSLRRVIANGINLDAITPVPAPENERPRIVFLGQPGHRNAGFDKILFLARQFRGWDFDLVGPTRDDFHRNLPSNATAHGIMTTDAYTPIMESADAAIGPLAFHRVGVSEVSALKTLEYLAWGIPTVIGYQDTHFMEPVDFILELPSSEDNVSANLDRIEKFVEGARGRRVPREAISHIGCDRTERVRVDLFEEVLAARRG
jgi:hypothetical protein